MGPVAILGAGNMGTALAHTVAVNGPPVRLWSIEEDVLEEIGARRLNSKYLPDVTLHERVSACWTLEEALAGASLAVFSVPSEVVRAFARRVAPHLAPGQALLNVAKGLEEGSGKRLSEVLKEELPGARIAAMGGPAIASEFARGAPTAVIVGSGDAALAAEVQATFQNEFFKVETTADVAGVEVGACLKNVYAIALGMCDGLAFGANTKAFVVSLSLGEMAVMIRALGGEGPTVYGLAGLGDLLTTGYSAHSRNRTLGERLCGDPNWQEFLHTHTVEGVFACRVAAEVGRGLGQPTPLLNVVHDVLFAGAPPEQTLRTFLRDFSFG